MLFALLACYGPAVTEPDCEYDECPESQDGAGELCCSTYDDPCGGEICWFRVDGIDFCESQIDDYVEYCYDFYSY